jgi:cell wall-associated NlpC family hydrolase
MSDESTTRRMIVVVADELASRVPHAPYIYGGKNPDAPTGDLPPGLDCSGFACWCMARVGLVPEGFGGEHNAASLWDLLSPLDEGGAVQPGDFAFYGTPIDHVMMLGQDGAVVGASGAGAGCVTVEQAEAVGACVHYKSSVNYRKDFVGYRALPIGGIAA